MTRAELRKTFAEVLHDEFGDEMNEQEVTLQQNTRILYAIINKMVGVAEEVSRLGKAAPCR